MGKYDDRPYAVGKGKPPREHQWQKGQSGNGRRTKPKPFSHELLPEMLHRIGQKKLTVNINGKSGRMTLAEALLQSTFIELLSGSQTQKLKAIELFDRLGVFAASKQNRASSEEQRRKFIEKLAEEATREHGD